MPRGKDRINNTDAVPIVTLQGCQFCLEHQAEIRRYFWDGTILCQRCSILSYGKDCESVGEKPYSQFPAQWTAAASTVLTRSVPDSAVHGGSSLAWCLTMLEFEPAIKRGVRMPSVLPSSAGEGRRRKAP
ncbi:hypothetical protein KCV05_g204, partial [Aureobasidium melanogenum]